MSDDTKQPAPDPEIPDEIKRKVNRKHRPAGFTPKSEAAEDDNEAPEVEEKGPVRDTKAFFRKLALVLKTTKPMRTVIETKDVKRKGEWVRETREIKVPVQLGIGADGLPFTTEPVTADETRRIRALGYKDSPKMDSNTGDLTPAFVEWLYLNHPYDAAVRYAARSTHVQVAAAARVA